MNINTENDVFKNCAWCGKYILENEQIIIIAGTFLQGSKYKKYYGREVDFTLNSVENTVSGFCPPLHSEIRKEGNDILFMVCSESCANALKKAFSDNQKKYFEKIYEL